MYIKRFVKHYYIMLIPALLWLFFFSIVPMFGIVMAFQDYNPGQGILHSKFVGLENFKYMFQMNDVKQVLCNTVVIAVGKIIGNIIFPLIFALLLNEFCIKRLKRPIQTIVYLPYFLSWISVIGIFQILFSSEGTVNAVLSGIFGDRYTPVNILMDPKYFLGIIFWTGQWKNVGWSSIVFLAAITGINQSLYEAAAVDGCSRFKQVFYITLPSIMPTIAIVFIMATASLVVSNFDQVYGFQNAYIQEKTEVINTLVYREGILNAEYSMATAFGIAQGLVSFILVFITNKIVKKVSDIGIW